MWWPDSHMCAGRLFAKRDGFMLAGQANINTFDTYRRWWCYSSGHRSYYPRCGHDRTRWSNEDSHQRMHQTVQSHLTSNWSDRWRAVQTRAN